MPRLIHSPKRGIFSNRDGLGNIDKLSQFLSVKLPWLKAGIIGNITMYRF